MITEEIINDYLDCSNAGALTVMGYFDKGFAVMIPKDRWHAFIKFYMLKSGPGSEKHIGIPLGDKIIIKRTNSDD